MNTTTPSQLSDIALVAEVKRLAEDERACTIQLVRHLAELDRRRLYLAAGFSSLFTYCTGVLRLSEGATYHRITAARAATRFPRLFAMLEEGALNLATVRLLAPHLTDDNAEELLAQATGKSKREVEELIARHAPRPAVPPSIRRVPADANEKTPQESRPEPAPLLLPEVPAAAPIRRAVVQPLAPDRYEIRFTATEKTRDKLRLAQDLLRHAIPSGDLAEVVDRALTALLEDLAGKKFAATKRARTSPVASVRSRHIPAGVKRAVWLRDEGRCRFISKDGRRCGERGFLEFHHLDPYAMGGEATVERIELRCRAHNAHEADLFYGPRRATGELAPGRVRARPAGSGGEPPKVGL